MLIKQFRVESLGNSSYIIGSEEAKVCAVVDPVRDVDLFIDEAQRLGMEITYSLETHVHNDFVSGSRELAARVGATVCASGAGGLLFDHRSFRHGDAITLGDVRLDVIATPGHTPEHISFLATDTAEGGGPHALFSGGALLVGGIARVDLFGEDLAPFLGRWFHRTIGQELKKLDDDVVVYPTHGGGSFCLANSSGSAATVSTIGQERTANPFFQVATEDEFVDLTLSNPMPVPKYYSRMAHINVRGPRILGGLPTLYPLAPREVWSRVQRDQVAIDIRSIREYASAHIPGSFSIPFGGSAGTWVGWLVEDGVGIVMLADDDPSSREEMVRQLVRVGYDSLEGYLAGGMDAWASAHLPVAQIKTITARDLYEALEGGEGPIPLDVRFGYEWRSGHVPEAVHIELGDLPERTDTLPRERSYATVCAAGVRASTAASILERDGFEDLSVLVGGTAAWQAAGLPVDSPNG